MNRAHLIIDVAKCIDCNDCFLACKDEFVGNDWSPHSVSQPLHGHRWINIMRKERGQYPLIDVAYLPTPCMHCDDADCIKAAENDAIYKREDGIVSIDPIKAKGQRAIVDSCPYGVIFWNEELDVPQKCTMCAHLLDNGWQEPRCVQACAPQALRFVFYQNLYRYKDCFIGGSIAVEVDGVADCVENGKVTLRRRSTKVSETTSDGFGDFKFDRLGENSGKYTLEISHADYETKTLDVDLRASINVGTIWL